MRTDKERKEGDKRERKERERSRDHLIYTYTQDRQLGEEEREYEWFEKNNSAHVYISTRH